MVLLGLVSDKLLGGLTDDVFAPTNTEPHACFRMDLTNKVMVPAEQHSSFVEYLYLKNLYVHVWDGDSLFEIGTVQIPLFQFLRQGRRTLEGVFASEIWESNTLGGSSNTVSQVQDVQTVGVEDSRT